MSARVLVVDDIEANRKLLCAKLAHEYFQVTTAVDGMDAIDKAIATEPDIILLDVMMPRMDGFEACRELKFDPRTEHIPIVMVTALNEREDRLKGLRAGADDFLTKPINDLQLLSRVRALSKYKLVADELRKREASGRRIGVIDVTPSGRGGNPARVLVVDDNERQAARICRYLETDHKPMTLANASSQPGGLGAGAATVDIMVLSLGGEKYDGLKLCAYLRNLEATRDLPILAIVDAEDEALAVKALDLGASDILVRPIDPEELLARVKTQVNKKRYIDSLRARLDQSMELAVTDQLTGLHNRRFMEKRLDQFVKRSNMGGGPVSILLCDLDHFKRVNDGHGHDVGDEVLREFSGRLMKNIRPTDIACRYGGEEFMVIMPDTTIQMAQITAERIRDSVDTMPFAINGGLGQLDITMSGGASVIFPPDDTVNQLIKRADEALYNAKESGRNKIICNFDGF
ncbi:PleD family two-component system response regulator [Hirschia maritima]|uniref:PleD family two-component system response regulator n=1 Tax=Hirschia maritima TaxID=1121961 RepID=UPI000372C122|nr:PleD family two-component system response regulator [Hirschia maritima]